MHNKSIDNFTIPYHETYLLVYIDFLELFKFENSQMHPQNINVLGLNWPKSQQNQSSSNFQNLENCSQTP